MMHDIRVKTEKLLNAYTPQLVEILNKNRRLTKQTLENCQMKRIRNSEIQVELRHLCIHFHRWSLLGREFSLQVYPPTPSPDILPPGPCFDDHCSQTKNF